MARSYKETACRDFADKIRSYGGDPNSQAQPNRRTNQPFKPCTITM